VNRRITTVALLSTLLGISLIIACVILLLFWRPIVFAAVLGIGFYPLHKGIHKFVARQNLSALITTLIVLLLFVLPIALLSFSASGDVIRAAQYVNHNFASRVPGEGVVRWLEQHLGFEMPGLQSAIDAAPAKVSQLMFKSATSLLKGLVSFLGQGVITLLILFFVFRDGAAIGDQLTSLLPLNRERVDRLFARVQDSVFANLYGILAVAIVQGLLTGGAVAIVGLPSPVLLGIVASFCSLIPLVGTSLVWLPASVFLFASGHPMKGAFLLGWGAIVVGSADNVIRPLIVMGRVKLHPLILLFALIGGVREFGLIGLFIGPIVMSLIVALAGMLQDEVSEVKRETAGVNQEILGKSAKTLIG
jgi:predicted PurR-regulated permease PerM